MELFQPGNRGRREPGRSQLQAAKYPIRNKIKARTKSFPGDLALYR